jgi:hypothetical protein
MEKCRVVTNYRQVSSVVTERTRRSEEHLDRRRLAVDF